jgi:hypothetical protein
MPAKRGKAHEARPQCEEIRRDECKLDVRLTVKEEGHLVYVVGGTFKLAPRAWRKADEADIYADHDPERVLANLSEQTGLTFRKEKRQGGSAYLSAGNPN